MQQQRSLDIVSIARFLMEVAPRLHIGQPTPATVKDHSWAKPQAVAPSLVVGRARRISTGPARQCLVELLRQFLQARRDRPTAQLVPQLGHEAIEFGMRLVVLRVRGHDVDSERATVG